MIITYPLRLGYKVADGMETLEFLAIIWSEYLDGQISINKVVQAYDDYEFDANQDLPGNACWEELYHASPKGTKVILTIRDSDEVWQNSMKKFYIQETKSRSVLFGISVKYQRW